MNSSLRIAILGAGPSSLFLCKYFLENNDGSFTLDIFEAGDIAGPGMPYSSKGAGPEHVTNVSSNEIAELFVPLADWLKSLDDEELSAYSIDRHKISEYKVIPRLLFGDYLAEQFNIFRAKARAENLDVKMHFGSRVTDIRHLDNEVEIEIDGRDKKIFDKIIICTGHYWPKTSEGKIPGFFDSPYPPAKIQLPLNHKVALRGSSLTAIDAIKTLARANGNFAKAENGDLTYMIDEKSPNFKIIMHSTHGLLPSIRFHLEETLISGKDLLSDEMLDRHIEDNVGYISLDYVFENSFKKPIKGKRPEFYKSIKNMALEEFVDAMLSRRENMNPFVLLQEEYNEAEKSIDEHRSIYWKEMLATLSFAINYPAKHFSAEDMLRLKKVLMPLISVIIAFVPQGSVDELLALYKAERLDLIAVGREGKVEPNPDGGAIYLYKDQDGLEHRDTYSVYVDCIGQKHFSFEEFPFESLTKQGKITPARVEFRNPESMFETSIENVVKEEGKYYLTLPGVAISDDFQIISPEGKPDENIFIMAVPYISGHNPDYSGLDFCEEASGRIVRKIVSGRKRLE